MAEADQFDVVVVGGGVIGLCTAYYLAKHHYKVLVLEQFPLPHTRGSSHGHSRLSKISHRKPFMVDAMPTAHRLWNSLQNETNISLFHDTGFLSIYDHQQQLFDSLRNQLEDKNIDFQCYSGKAIEDAFPGLAFSENVKAIFEPNGILLKADKCLAALKKEIIKNGGIIHDEEKVLSVSPVNNQSAHVRTNVQVYKSKSVVLACGPWIKKMMKKLNTPIASQSVRVTAYFWKERQEGLYSVESNFPPIMIYFDHYHLYSTPSMEYDSLIKICYHHRAPVDPDSPDVIKEEDTAREEERLDVLKKLIAKHFPQLEPIPVLKETYLQTISADFSPMIDRHPLHSNIIIGGNFSGYGFGVAPAFGEVLGKLATFTNPDYCLESLSYHNNVANSKL